MVLLFYLYLNLVIHESYLFIFIYLYLHTASTITSYLIKKFIKMKHHTKWWKDIVME